MDTASHTGRGNYNSNVLQLIMTDRPDSDLFLDPYFRQELENLNEKVVLDAGCGAGIWAIHAAKNGGQVCAIDIQESMIELARKNIESSNVTVDLIRGDVTDLPYDDESFDLVISMCVACNLLPESFDQHLAEFYRTVKKGGTVIIGAAHSNEIVFTDGSRNKDDVLCHIQKILDELPNDPTSELISCKLMKLQDVLSATFYVKDGRLTLMTGQHIEGERIWRKLPKVVVPNYYYSMEHYLAIAKRCGFSVSDIKLPHFDDETTLHIHNEGLQVKLGEEYVYHAPFAIFYLVKQ